MTGDAVAAESLNQVPSARRKSPFLTPSSEATYRTNCQFIAVTHCLLTQLQPQLWFRVCDRQYKGIKQSSNRIRRLRNQPGCEIYRDVQMDDSLPANFRELGKTDSPHRGPKKQVI